MPDEPEIEDVSFEDAPKLKGTFTTNIVPMGKHIVITMMFSEEADAHTVMGDFYRQIKEAAERPVLCIGLGPNTKVYRVDN